jgi:hypothetical protein
MSKRALIVGINEFTQASWRLNGCVNDAIALECLLKLFYGFKEEGIRQLRDGDATKANLEAGLSWLLSDYDGDGSDVRVFTFSSHGTQVEDQNDDEWDQLDEVLVPHDHDWDDPLRDDDLWDYFKEIPENVSFTFLADCCHSGTAQKALPKIVFKPRFLEPPIEVIERVKTRIGERDNKVKKAQADALAELIQQGESLTAAQIQELLAATEKEVKKSYGVVAFERHFLLAGSEDVQTAADAVIGGEWRGAMSWGVGEAIMESGGDLTYAELIDIVGKKLKDYDQRPQLECPKKLRNHKLFAPFG